MSDMTTDRFDVFDPRVFGRGIPHATFARLRADHPVHWQQEPEMDNWPAGPGFWAVTRHADVAYVLRNAKLYSSWLGATQIRDPEPDDLPRLRNTMLNMDPPEHGRLRRVVSRAFTQRHLDRFIPQLAERARWMVDTVAERGGCDLPNDLTDEYALRNLAALMGVPQSDRGLLLEWTNRVIGFQDPDHAVIKLDASGRPINPRSPDQLRDMFDYATELVERKRRAPGDDVMSVLANARLEGDGLRLPEIWMFFFLLVIAGNDTVRAAIPGGVLALIEHPAERRRLLANPDLLPTAVEETLRWHPPVLSFRRTASAPTTLAGQAIDTGDKVVVYHISASFDERVFPDPFRFDIGRNPNPHLAFGDGPHVCLGARFARAQLTAFYREFLWRFPDIELAGQPVRLVSNFINGLKRLPLSYTPSRRRTLPGAERT